jgi:hypothetical protein
MSATGPTDAVQAALVQAMLADAGLAALVGVRVYDDVPDDTPLPYISLGPEFWQPFEALCLDGAEGFVQVDVWSDSVGRVQCREIVERAVALFNGASAPAVPGGGWRLTACSVAGFDIVRDARAHLRHGWLRLDIAVERDSAP